MPFRSLKPKFIWKSPLGVTVFKNQSSSKSNDTSKRPKEFLQGWDCYPHLDKSCFLPPFPQFLTSEYSYCIIFCTTKWVTHYRWWLTDEKKIVTYHYERHEPRNDSKMTLFTIPKIDYTNTECRSWITAQLRAYYVFIPLSTATAIAKRFIGSGLTMFAMEREMWVNMLGIHGHFIRSSIRRILWNKKRAMKAGFSLREMYDLRGEYKPDCEPEESLNWSGLYPIR